ncbi:MAG: 50S ribosomal protein L6 [Candidatus Eremiobacteraeota bacterium]|nr:50S ribosomal protein L6 [Candidatus Eremiobacteraeota bacterium]MBV8282329.1 50S ribosomal protein L6 [Candidatus Eremiobacteraeota bacterium]
MSRIGKMPIAVPSGVNVGYSGRVVTVKGPKGELKLECAEPIEVKVESGAVNVTRPNDDKRSKQLHGLTRTLIANMVRGVTSGFSKNLEIVGVGYRAQAQGKKLNVTVGYSHPVVVEPPAGIDIKVEGTNKITVSGADKQMVGQLAAQIRAIRPPEPYKGKGIRYEGERVRRKLGKAGKTAGAAGGGGGGKK